MKKIILAIGRQVRAATARVLTLKDGTAIGLCYYSHGSGFGVATMPSQQADPETDKVGL